MHHALNYRGDLGLPRRQGLGEVARKLGVQSADALPSLGEVPGVKCTLGQKRQDVRVNGGSDGLHRVECQGRASAQVYMENAKPGV